MLLDLEVKKEMAAQIKKTDRRHNTPTPEGD